MVAVGGHDKLAPAHGQQVIFGHDPSHPFVVHNPALILQIPFHAPIPVTVTVREHDLLNPGSQFHLFGLRLLLLPAAIKTGPAHPRHMTHLLDGKVFLRLLYLADFFVDAVSPEPSLARRRASILRKAPCKKSASSTFLASASRNRRFSRSNSC